MMKEEATMYRISGKQLVGLAMITALIAVAAVIIAQRAFDRSSRSPATFGAGLEPVVIADPTVATDEQNNIDIYQADSPAVVNITSKVYQQTLFGVYPSEGSGSGSIIDEKGYILTNYHVVQNTSELEVQ